MKRIVSGLAAALLGVVLAHAEAGQDGVLSAQQKFVDAYRTCNVAELNKLVTDDMQFIHVGGMTQDKTTFVAGVGQCALADLKISPAICGPFPNLSQTSIPKSGAAKYERGPSYPSRKHSFERVHETNETKRMK